MTELFTLPQIVAARTTPARDRAAALFGKLTDTIVDLEPGGGRAGQADDQLLALHQVRSGQPVLHDGQRPRPRLRPHPRGDDPATIRVPQTSPGPASPPGPCLFKDTMQLAVGRPAASFALGHSAMIVNEGLPDVLVSAASRRVTTCTTMTVGILGMAFKAESDDRRSSLSYRLKRVLEFQRPAGADHRPLCQRRPRAAPARARSWPRPISSSSALRTPSTRTSRSTIPVVDVWNLLGNGLERVTCVSQVSVVIPAYDEGEGIGAVCRPSPRRDHPRPTRSWSWSTAPTTRRSRRSTSMCGARPSRQDPGQHLRARPGQRHPLRHRPRQPPGRRRDDGGWQRRPAG